MTRARLVRDSCKPDTVPDRCEGELCESAESEVEDTTLNKVPNSVAVAKRMKPPKGAINMVMHVPTMETSTKRAVPSRATASGNNDCAAAEAKPMATKNKPRIAVESANSVRKNSKYACCGEMLQMSTNAWNRKSARRSSFESKVLTAEMSDACGSEDFFSVALVEEGLEVEEATSFDDSTRNRNVQAKEQIAKNKFNADAKWYASADDATTPPTAEPIKKPIPTAEKLRPIAFGRSFESVTKSQTMPFATVMQARVKPKVMRDILYIHRLDAKYSITVVRSVPETTISATYVLQRNPALHDGFTRKNTR